jgi:hypothetical protein
MMQSNPLLAAANAVTANAAKMTKGDVQTAAISILALSSMLAKFTATTRDDAVVALLTSVVMDPVKFDQLYLIMYPGTTPTV